MTLNNKLFLFFISIILNILLICLTRRFAMETGSLTLVYSKLYGWQILMNICILVFLLIFLYEPIFSNINTVLLFSFIYAGGISNLIENLLYGSVLDYIPFTLLKGNPLFYFNLSDIYISVGVLTLIVFEGINQSMLNIDWHDDK